MAYTITRSDGIRSFQIADGTLNTTSCSLSLPGRNYAPYGQPVDQDLVRMLEHFASNTIPQYGLQGQLWFDIEGTVDYPNLVSSNSVLRMSVEDQVGPNTSNENKWIPLVTSPFNGTMTFNGPAIFNNVANFANALNLNANITSPGNSVTNNNVVNGTIVVSASGGIGLTNGNVTTNGNVQGNWGNFNNIQLGNTSANIIPYANNTGNVGGTSNYFANGYINNLTGNGNIYGYANIGNTTNYIGNGYITNIFGSHLGNATNPFQNAYITNLFTPNANITGGNVTGLTILGNVTNPIQAANIANLSMVGGNINNVGNIGNAALPVGNIYANNFIGGNITGNVTIANALTFSNVAGAPVGTTYDGSAVRTVSYVTVGAAQGNPINNYAIGISNPANTTGMDPTTGNIYGAWTLSPGATLSATYADLGERFAADDYYDAGTVVELGGTHEITAVREELSDRILGVISDTAGYLMNAGAGNNFTHPVIAMTGRVPVKVIGKVSKGDRLVSAGKGIARAAKSQEATPFNTVGRSLEDKVTDDHGKVLAAVSAKL